MVRWRQATEITHPMIPFDQLQPHQQRVVNEHAELLQRTEKLDLFQATDIYHNLPEAERRRMDRQLTYMQLYLNVLQERIEAFQSEYERTRFTFQLNGQPVTVDEDGQSQEDLVRMVYPECTDTAGISVVYEYADGSQQGSLVAGQSIRVHNGMVVNVMRTDNA